MSKRMERANSEIQKALSEIFLQELKNPQTAGLLSVLSVKTSPDFRYSKIRVGILSDDQTERKQAFENLKKSASFVQKTLCEKIRMPQCPKLDFVMDEGSLHSQRINKILENLVIPEVEEE